MQTRIWKSAASLADGREIIYFDEAPGLGRDKFADTRDLGRAAQHGRTGVLDTAQGTTGGLRWDPLLGEWIAFATNRQDRTFLPAADSCPLCPSRPGAPTEIPAPDYDVAVFENRFPAFSGTATPDEELAGDIAPAGQTRPGQPGASQTGGLLASRRATGRCEVVCFTPDHDASFATLTPERVQTVVAAWADRTAELGAMPGIQHVFCFENRGQEVGVTLQHPHGQIYAVPFVPPRTQQMLASARAYQAGHAGRFFDDYLAAQLADGRRIVDRNDEWTAFVPAAPHWPFEIMLFPARRVPDLAALTESAAAAFGEVYLRVLGRLDRLFGTPMPYLAAWQQAPARDAPARADFALHLQVMAMRRAPGKLKYMATTETGAGIWSNDVLPDTAARMLREAG
ncbi:MAG TPA: galactose-1-phosphate uridylyltransferase [Streptosporangiaceae bacterium]|jgi:UDPglucose--hexose-1-phosphate uridylyltransferase